MSDAQVFPASDAGAVVTWSSGATEVAVGSPDRWSTARHADDETRSPKFRTARCAEIALGRQQAFWVPWTTPVIADNTTWISVGLSLFAALRDGGHDPIEVYPHAAFRVLNGNRPLPKKQTPAGVAARVTLLETSGVTVPFGAARTHDALDAAMAASVAQPRDQGQARAVSCGHDGSAIWLPSPPGVAEAPATAGGRR